jgi:electron transport complex protein RnfG
MLRAMVGVGIVCGLLIVTAYQATGPVIARNRAAALERAIFEVLPEARSSRTVELGDAGERVHAGYDEDGSLVGIAVEAEGMGYQDSIRLLYGYSLDRSAIIGIRVLESRETPGLGDKIETDPVFLANFAALDVTLAASGSELAHPIELVKPGAKEHPWQIDAITGATISSRAIADMLKRSASRWVPLLSQRRDELRRTEAE